MKHLFCFIFYVIYLLYWGLWHWHKVKGYRQWFNDNIGEQQPRDGSEVDIYTLR